MAKKNLNIALIILVVIIYSGLFFRIIQPTQDSIEEMQSDLLYERKKETIITKPEIFELHLNKRDPFLDKMKTSFKPDTGNSSVFKKKSNNVIQSSPLIWPEVQYLGFISGMEDTKTVVIRIDKVIFRLNKGEEVFGIKLRKIFKDSVEISLKNQKKIIKK